MSRPSVPTIQDVRSPAKAQESDAAGAEVATPKAKVSQKLGRYRILFEIARGGMGTVYAAVLPGPHKVERIVAVKTLSAQGLSADDLAGFIQEARVTAKLSHPNVVETFELDMQDGDPYLVMQLVQGVSLSRLLHRLSQRGERLDVDLAAWIIAQAAAGLHAAHELEGEDGATLGLVHRDVSPQNLLVSYEGRVCVADFGVAKLFESQGATSAGIIKGKFGYMSPEQTRAETLDRRSDVFSLGVVLYEAIAGKLLYADLSPADAVRRISSDSPENLSNEREGVPLPIADIVRACMERSREERFQTCAEVRDAIRTSLRARAAHVDETDLAALVARLFAKEKEDLAARLKSALAARLDDAPRSEAPTPIHESRGSVTATIGGAVVVPRRSRAGFALLVAGAILVAVLVVGVPRWLKGPSSPEPSAATHATLAPNPSAARVAESSRPAPEVVVTAPELAPSASAAAEPPRVATTVRPKAAPLPSVAAPASSSPSSHKGVPFREP